MPAHADEKASRTTGALTTSRVAVFLSVPLSDRQVYRVAMGHLLNVLVEDLLGKLKNKVRADASGLPGAHPFPREAMVTTAEHATCVLCSISASAKAWPSTCGTSSALCSRALAYV